MMKAAWVGVATLCLTGTASAEDLPLRPWLLRGTLSATQSSDGGDTALGSGSISLERSVDNAWAGVSVAASQGEDAPPPLLTTTVADQSSVQAAAWFGGAVGAYDVTLSIGLGRQSLEGEARVASDTAPAALVDQSFGFDSETTATSVGLFVSRTFGEVWTFTPSFGVSYDRSEIEQTGTVRTGAAPIRVESTSDGVTGSLGSTVSGPVNDVLTVSFGAAAYATDNGAAQTFRFDRQGDISPFASEPEGSMQWGEVSAGVTWWISDRVSISGTAGTTIGRQTDTAFGSTGVDVRF